MTAPGDLTIEPAVIDGRAVFIVRRRGYLIAQVGTVEELAEIVPLDQLSEPRNDVAASKTAGLDLEAVISIAEQTMEDGLAGRVWDVPEGNSDDPAYRAAMVPLEEFCSKVVGSSMYRKVYYSQYTLEQAGNPQAMVTSMGSIVVRPGVNTMTLLHECAHLITRTQHGVGGHTPEFVKVARDLYTRYISPAAGQQFWGVVSMHESLRTTAAGRADRVYGKGSIDALFPDGAPSTSCPWPMAGRFKASPMYDQAAVTKALSDPNRVSHMAEFDPRDLRSTQPSILRAVVAYYLTDQYRQTGETFADQANPGNKTPVVYVRADGQQILLSGHHRAAVALLRGQPLYALRVEDPSVRTGSRLGVGDPVAVPRRAAAADQERPSDHGGRSGEGDQGGRHRCAACELVGAGGAGGGLLHDPQDRDASSGAGQVRVVAGPNGGRIPQGVKARPPFGSDLTKPRGVKIDRLAGGDIADLDPDERSLVMAALHRLERGVDRTIEAKHRPPLTGTFTLDITGSMRVCFYLHRDGAWHVYAVLPDHDYSEAERRMRMVAKTASTYTVFVGWGARTPNDPARALSHGRIVVVEADSDTEAHTLANQMVNSGGTNPISALLPDGMPTSTTILSMEARKTAAPNVTRIFNGDGKTQYEYNQPYVGVAMLGPMSNDPNVPKDIQVQVPWDSDLRTSIRKAEQEAERFYGEEPWANWAKKSRGFFLMLGSGQTSAVVGRCTSLGQAWQSVSGEVGRRDTSPNFLRLLDRPKDAFAEFCKTIADAQPPGYNLHPLTMGKDIVTIYRGVSLEEGMDPANSDKGDGANGWGKGVGSSWTLDLAVAKSIAERGQAGFSNTNSTFGKPKSVKAIPIQGSSQRPRAVVLRAEVDLSQNASLLTDGRMYYASEQEVNLDPGTKFTFTGYLEADRVPVDRMKMQHAIEQAKAEMAKQGYSFLDYEITYRWPTSWHTMHVQRTAGQV